MTWAGHLTGPGYACQGNILASEGVVNAMAEAFIDPDVLAFMRKHT